MSRQGVSGKGIDADVDAGTLFTPSCQGHSDHPGGGKPPPSMVPPVRYAGALEGAEREAYYHHPVCQGGVAEETASGGRGYAGERGEVLSGLWKTS